MARRRAHGDGGLFVRGRGTDRERWVGRITLADGTRKDVYGRTQAEARRKLEDLKRAASMGLRLTVIRQTTGEFLVDWLEHTARPALRPTTYRAYETRVRLYLVPHVGKIPLSQVTPQHVQDLQNVLLQTPCLARNGVSTRYLSPATVLDTRRVLGKALGQAAKWGLIARNPVPLVDPPSVHRPETRPFNLAEARTLLEALKGNRLEALYTVVLALGLRRGEALGLKWDDIDLERGSIRIQRALYRAEGRLQLMDVKTPKSRRTIALPQFALRVLGEHRRRQADERDAAQSLWIETGLVFTTAVGGPLEPRNVNRHFAGVLRTAGLPHQRFHDLRHACATLMLVQGQDLKVVQEVLGHTSIATTGNIYAHVLMGLKRQAAAGMDALFDASERAQT